MAVFRRNLQFTFSQTLRYYCYKPVSRRDTVSSRKKTAQNHEEKSLSEILTAHIATSGPITVADYMKHVLTNPSRGYYMNRDVFGQKGDFITSPEISQLFGEMVAVWIVNELEKIGNPRPLQLIELGPGRGTLMQDILRVMKHLNQVEDLSVHFVEVSPFLSSLQAQNLCSDSDVTTGLSPYNPVDPHRSYHLSGINKDKVEIYWYNRIEDIPTEFSVILAHEFFDALPIHKFQKTKKGWKEVLIKNKENSTNEFEYVLSRGESPVSKVFIKKTENREHVEISPESAVLMEHIGLRLEEYGGFSLLVDYGHNGEKTDTFRGFKKHQLHDPLLEPGSADLTADVDFSFLKEVVQEKLLTFGPVNQGQFLKSLGIKERLNVLLESVDNSTKEQLRSGYNMIVDSDQMGDRFKFFAMFPLVLEDHLKNFPVAGFTDN